MKVKTKALLHLMDSMLAMQKEIEGLRNDLNELRERIDADVERPAFHMHVGDEYIPVYEIKQL